MAGRSLYWHLTIQSGKLSLAVLPWVGAMYTVSKQVSDLYSAKVSEKNQGA